MSAWLGCAALVALVLAGCVDVGPPRPDQITGDIEANAWTRGRLPPVIPGDPLPIETGDRSPRFEP